MTPYARCSTRLSRRRDEENVFWRTRKGGDPRLTGLAAHAKMNETFYGPPAPQAFVDILRDLLMPRLPKFLRKHV